MRWLEETIDSGVRERAFELSRSDRRIPGLLWTPVEERARSLVLIAHGASGSKRDSYVEALARRFTHRGSAVVAIDGPIHGDRRADGPSDGVLVMLQFSQVWASDAAMTDEMVYDWRMTLDSVQELDEVGGEGPVGWWGLSMGTIIGLPVVAAEPRISAAVLGLAGLTGPTKERLAKDAPLVTCPLLFLVQWDDELFSREACCDLFSAFASQEKRMYACGGIHAEVPTDAFELSELFVSTRLGLVEEAYGKPAAMPGS